MNTPVIEGYPYGTVWKQSVQRSGEEWRAYCEAVFCLKRYFRTKRLAGKDAAKAEYDGYCASLDHLPRGGGARRVARLKSDFLLIGANEGEAIGAELANETVGQRAIAA